MGFCFYLRGYNYFLFQSFGFHREITKKIDKKIPGTQEIAFFIGGALLHFFRLSDLQTQAPLIA
jgi:hypothetical protein